MEAVLPVVFHTMFEAARDPLNVHGKMEYLFREGQQLEAIRNDMEMSLEAARRQQLEPHQSVVMWLKRSTDVLSQLHELESTYWEWRDPPDNFIVLLLTCGCHTARGFRLLSAASSLLFRTRELMEQRNRFETVANPPPVLLAEKLPKSISTIVGREGTLDEIWSCLSDDHVGVIGICGMGGVGKTTLLVALNNDISRLENCGFDIVVWATVSRDLDVRRLQEQIARRCSLPLRDHGGAEPSYDDNRREWRRLLCRFLATKRFLLILDDMWQGFDLIEVGIPRPDGSNNSKILFSTRSEYVCDDMDADKRIQIDPLGEDDSWNLFRTKVPAAVLDWGGEYARPVVAACGGLPLALITVGRAMAGRKRPDEWVLARELMLESPMEIRGMDTVIYILKFSFDALTSDLPRSCLLRCSSVFPAGQDIGVEELVDSFIEGGLLSEGKAELARARGHGVVGDLRAVFLLHTGTDPTNQVRMHPMVRSMTLRIAEESGMVQA